MDSLKTDTSLEQTHFLVSTEPRVNRLAYYGSIQSIITKFGKRKLRRRMRVHLRLELNESCNLEIGQGGFCANEKAWMTLTVFIDYLQKWDNELVKEKRQIRLVVDNRPAHPEVALHNVKLHSFTPNFSSATSATYGPWSNLELERNLLQANVTFEAINLLSIT